LKVRVRDLDVYYEVHGAGPRLLFIGGSGGDLRQKPRVFDGPLVRRFEVLSYDQRGLGQTDRPPGPYTMADYGEDAAALLAAVGWDSCLVMGVSFGGMVVQELSARHPQRVRRLVLACTSSGGVGKPSFPLHELQALPEEERVLRHIELADTRCDAAWRAANPEAADKLLAFARGRSKVGEGEAGREQGARLQLEARAGHDTWDRLAELSMPVYLCGGKYDGIAPPENQRAMASVIPDARLELFEGGHMFLIQDRSAFPKIEEFLLEPSAS
jgi:3-oxoadipate enol-lactonase